MEKGREEKVREREGEGDGREGEIWNNTLVVSYCIWTVPL